MIPESTLEDHEKEKAALAEEQQSSNATTVWCPICLESTEDPTHDVLECGSCHLKVHKGCVIAHTEAASANWTCEPCRASDTNASCMYCPVTKGLLKPTMVASTSSTKWAHPLCMKLTEDGKRSASSDPRTGGSNQLECYICGSAAGACVPCTVSSCERSFHVGCMLLRPSTDSEDFKARRSGIGFRARGNMPAARTLVCDAHAKLRDSNAQGAEGATCTYCGKAGEEEQPVVVCGNRVGRCETTFHPACAKGRKGQDLATAQELCKDCQILTDKFTLPMLAGKPVVCLTCSASFSSLHALDVHTSSNPRCYEGAKQSADRMEIDPGTEVTVVESDGDGTESDRSLPETGARRTKAKPTVGVTGVKGSTIAVLPMNPLKRKLMDAPVSVQPVPGGVQDGRDQLRARAAASSLVDLGDAEQDTRATEKSGLAAVPRAADEACDSKRAQTAAAASSAPPAGSEAAEPEKQSQGLGALKWCAGGAGGGGRWLVDGTNVPSPAEKKAKFDQQIQTSKTSKEQTLIGEGIMISGGRVLMQNGNAELQNVALCVYCQRTFISAHALDVHLSRNQACRHENEQAKARNKNTPTGMQHPVKQYMERRPQTALKGGFAGMASHGESCRDVMSAFMRRPEAARFKPPSVGLEDPGLTLTSVNRKASSMLYTNAYDMRDDVLVIWKKCLSQQLSTSALSASVRQLSLEFDVLFEAAMDKVRGMGGTADANFFRHGLAWVGQKVKVFVPHDHSRILGVIDEYDEVDETTHLYHIQYDDGGHQWTTLPNAKVELVGWVPEEEFKNPLATYVANASNIPALKATSAQPGAKQTTVPSASETAARAPTTDRPSVAKETTGSAKTMPVMTSSAEPYTSIQCPNLKEGQDVEMLVRGKGRYAAGKVVAVGASTGVDIRTAEGELFKGVVDDFVRVPEGSISHEEMAQIVAELKKKPQYDYFDNPVDDQYVPNYYHPNPAARQRGITAWNTQSMCFAWMEKKAAKKQYPNVSEVEYDFNLIVSNAVIFNPPQHPVNREARRLFQAAKAVFSKWSRKPGCYSCKTCHKDDASHEPIVICDWCCRGIHQHCFLQAGSRALWLWAQEVGHPFRGDSAFFCSEPCLQRFSALADSFKLPPSSLAAQEASTKRFRPNSDAPKHSAPAGSGMPVPPRQTPRPSTQVPLSDKVMASASAASAAAAAGSSSPADGAPTRSEVLAKNQAEVRDMKNSVLAIRAARDNTKACQRRYQTAQEKLQEALTAQTAAPALFDEAQRSCQLFEKTVAAGSASKERFLWQTGASQPVAEQAKTKIKHLKNTSITLAQLSAAWSMEKKALARCQNTQKALQDVLQGHDDPPDELLEAAEQACEEYDRAMSSTATLRDKYLSLRCVS